MHVFDLDEEKAATPEQFDIQIARFGNPSKPMSPQYRAEAKAYWRALAVLCPEAKRLEFKADLEAERKSFEVVGAALRIPSIHVRDLVGSEFEAARDAVLQP